MKTKALFLWVLTAALAGCVQLEEPNGPASLQDDRSHESPPNGDLIWDCLSRQMETGELSYRVTAREAMILADILEEDIDDYEIEYLTHEADTLMYILNSSNGWKLLSSDKRTQPVLAYGENGTFSIDSSTRSPSVGLSTFTDERADVPPSPKAPKIRSYSPGKTSGLSSSNVPRTETPSVVAWCDS